MSKLLNLSTEGPQRHFEKTFMPLLPKILKKHIGGWRQKLAVKLFGEKAFTNFIFDCANHGWFIRDHYVKKYRK